MSSNSDSLDLILMKLTQSKNLKPSSSSRVNMHEAVFTSVQLAGTRKGRKQKDESFFSADRCVKRSWFFYLFFFSVWSFQSFCLTAPWELFLSINQWLLLQPPAHLNFSLCEQMTHWCKNCGDLMKYLNGRTYFLLQTSEKCCFGSSGGNAAEGEMCFICSGARLKTRACDSLLKSKQMSK